MSPAVHFGPGRRGARRRLPHTGRGYLALTPPGRGQWEARRAMADADFPRAAYRPDLTVGRMQNAEMVDAILDGQGAGLAAASDRYAPALYGYCRGLLGEPAAAADAV